MVAPYGPQLTFQEFREILEQRHECTCYWLVHIGEIIDLDGAPAPGMACFKRTVKAVVLEHPVVVFLERQMMTRTVLRSTCAALEIDTETFQLYLQ